MKAALKFLLSTRCGWAASAPLRAQGTYVLMYHRITLPGDFFEGVTLENFRRHMRWVKEHCTPIWPEDVLRACARPWRGKPPVVVTFDDGYRDYYDRAYPVLQELGIPAAVFLSTHYMDHGGLLWTEHVHWAVMRSRRETLERPWAPGSVAVVADERSRHAFVAEAKRRLKEARDDDRRRWADAIIHAADADEPEKALGRQMLSWDEVRGCTDGTCIGGHAHTHPVLSRMSAEAVDHEIATCHRRIATETGRPPVAFAYPTGRACDFNEDTRRSLAKNGFRLSFSAIPGVNITDTDAFALRRLHNWDSSVGDLAALMLKSRWHSA